MQYEWQGIGLEITFDGGKSVFLQGDEGSTMHDELEACETGEQADALMSEYLVLLEADDCWQAEIDKILRSWGIDREPDEIDEADGNTK